VGHFARIGIADRAHAVHHLRFDERGLQKIFESHACIRGIVFPRGCFRARLEEFNQSELSKLIYSSAALNLKFPRRTCRDTDRNFKFAAQVIKNNSDVQCSVFD